MWCIVFLFQGSKPPSETKLIDTYSAHRADYDRLRDMLLADTTVLRVASWGVETTNSGILRPSQGGLPTSRYNEYLALLGQVGGKWAFRDRGEQPAIVGIGVWAGGFGGDTRHIEICWLKQEPDNLIASLEDHYKTSRPRTAAFRRIEGNWYLRAD